MTKPDEILLNDLVLSVKTFNDIEKLENIVLKGIGKSKATIDSALISHLQYIINTYFQNFNPDDMSYKYLSTLLSFIKLISEGIHDTYNWDLTKHDYALLLESCLRSARIYLKVNPKQFSFLLHIVCDTIQLLASRSAIIKNALFKEMSVCLLKLLVHGSVVIHEKLYVSKQLTLLLQGSDKTLSAELCWKVRRYLCRLVEYLHKIGDFTMQYKCVTVIFGYSASIPEARNKIASYFRNPELEKQFISIPSIGFIIECRKFLNNLNKMQGSSASVITLTCLHVFMGRLEVFKPEYPGYTEFWMDVNTGMQRITFICDPNSFQIKGGDAIAGWELIKINSQDVEKYELLSNVIDTDNAGVMQLRIWLRNACEYRCKTSMDVIKKTKVITFQIKRSDFMTELKNNVLPTMFGKSVKLSESEMNIISAKQNIMASHKNSDVKKSNITSRKKEGNSNASYSNVRTGNEEVSKEILISPSKVNGTQFTNSADSIKEMYKKLSAHKNVKYAVHPECNKKPDLSQIVEIQDSQISNFDKNKNISDTSVLRYDIIFDNSLHNAVNEISHKVSNRYTKKECKVTETNISQEKKTISKKNLQCILDDWNQSLIDESLSINSKEIQQENNTEGIGYSEKVEQKSGNLCNKPDEIPLVPINVDSRLTYAKNSENKAHKSKVTNKKGSMHLKKRESHLNFQRSCLGCKSSELKGSSVDDKSKDGEFLKKVSNLCIQDSPMKLKKEHSPNHRTHASSMSKTLPRTEDIQMQVDEKKIQQSIDKVSSDAKNGKNLFNEMVDIIICDSVSPKENCKIPIVALNNLKCSRDQNMIYKANISATCSSELNKDLVASHVGKCKESHLQCTNEDYHNIKQPLETELPQQSFKISEKGATPVFSIDVSVTETEIKPKQTNSFNQVFDSEVNKLPICKENFNDRSDALSTNVNEIKDMLRTETKKNNNEHLDSDNSSSFEFIFPNSSNKIKDIFKVSEQKYYKTTKTVESVITLSERKVVAQRKHAKGQEPAKKRKLFSLNEGEINKNSKNGITEVNWSKAISTSKFSKQIQKPLQNSSRTPKKPSVSIRNSVHNKKEMNESKLSVFSDFNSEDDVIPDFLQKLVRPIKKKNLNKNQKCFSTNVQNKKEIELVASLSSDETFKNRKIEKQEVKFKTEKNKLKRQEGKEPLKNTSEINNKSNISISINTPDYNQNDEFDKLFGTKIESKNIVSQNTVENSINYKCTNALKNNSCLKSNNLSTKIPVIKNKYIKNNDILSRIKLKNDQNVTYFEKKSLKKVSPAESLSDSSCNSNHPRCQPLSKVMKKNLLQRNKEKLNSNLKSIDNPSSNSLNEFKSPVFSKYLKTMKNVFEDSNYKNITDNSGKKNKKQKLMQLDENKECFDSFYNNSVCNSRLVDEKSTKSKYINQTTKHTLVKECDTVDQNYSDLPSYIGEVKNSVTKSQNPVENLHFPKKRSTNSRILKDITNQANMKQFGSHGDQIEQNLKKMFEKISQNSSTPNPNLSNSSFSVGTDISSINKCKGFEKNKNESHKLNYNVNKHYTTSNNSSFDLSNISQMPINSSSNMAVNNKDDKSSSSLGSYTSFISDHNSVTDQLHAERNGIEGRNIKRKVCSTKKFNCNILKHKMNNGLSNKENHNSIKIRVNNSSPRKKLPLLDNNCNDFQKKSLTKCFKKYKNVKNKITCENKERPVKSTAKKHKKSALFQSKTQTTNKLDAVSQLLYRNKISDISNIVVSQTNTKCEDWCQGFKSNDSFTSSSLSDGTDNDLVADNITVASELQDAVSFHLKNKFKVAENFSKHVITVLQNNLENMELNDEKIWKSSIHKYKQKIYIQLNDAAKTMESIEQQMSDLKNVENLVKQISESLEPKFQLALEKIQTLHQTNSNMLEELSSLNKSSLQPTNQLEATMEYLRTVIDNTIAQQSVNALATIRSTVSKMLSFE